MDLAAEVPRRRLYYWVHHTGRYGGNTGVQRVVRTLAAALADLPGIDIVPVRWCADREAIVVAEPPWLAGLAQFGGPALVEHAQSGMPLHLASDLPQPLDKTWLLIGEVPHVGGGAPDAPAPLLPVALDYARYYGLRAAMVFYDLIPLRERGYEAMAPAHAAYADALAAADLVLPISRTAASDLLAWWHAKGHDPHRLPQPRPLLLPAEVAGSPRIVAESVPAEEDSPLRLLALGTVEPRKNQLALMRALNRLRARRPDLDISLDVVGALHGAVADAVRQEADLSDRHIRLHHYLPDEAVGDLMRDCDATVFLSLAEGFGLPIVESLWRGKPCLCSDLGSMAEIAAGGGCLTVDPRDPDAIEAALERLADDAALRADLARQARARPLASWQDYARSVLAELDATPPLPLLAVVEGTRGGAPLAAALEAASVRVWRHHWRADTQAILPGFRDRADAAPDGSGIGRGDLRGLWGVLTLASTTGPAEAMRIQDEARGLGLKLAVALEPGQPIDESVLALLAGADLALFATEAERDAALALAFKTLPRTATLRHRFRFAADIRALLGEIAAERPRIATVGHPQAPKRIFYWTGLTATQPFNTGIQRVVRSLGRALCDLGVELIPVKWDAAAGRMATLAPDEAAILAQWGGPPARPLPHLPRDLAGAWLLVPEIAVPSPPPGSNPARLARSLGMRVAGIFYDLIPLKMEHLYPPGTVPGFAEYWRLFSDSEVALPISWTVAADLRRYLSGQGLSLPAIVPCPLAGDLGTPRRSDVRAASSGPLRLLATGTLEPRKNYPRLLRALIAARRLAPARPIHLAIVGRSAGYKDLDADIRSLIAEAGNVAWHDHASDAQLLALFDQSDATMFGSWEEGFGLPVLESLWQGLPCLCHDGSAMAEVAVGGGTLAVDMLDEAAIARGIARLASEDGLLDRLKCEAVARPIRTWDDHARDILAALSRPGPAPGWPRPAILGERPRPLLSCAITTYNRAHWLKHSLPRLIEAARPFGDRVEVVVCDNTSTDATPDVIARFAGTPNFSSRRNPVNVGMLGNLGATARATNGAYVWLIGDDDLIVDGAIGAVLAGLEAHPDVEMAYMNYAYTNFDAPDQLADAGEVVRNARPIGHGGPNRRVAALRDVAALNENLFTAIYACAFRRDHALRAYQQDVSGPPFSSLLTCVPSSVYALAVLQDRPAWWVGQPALVVNMNVSWLRWALPWHLERMPDLFDAADLSGIDPVRVDRHRVKHCRHAGEWARAALMEAEDAIRHGFSVARLIERCKHLEEFTAELPKLRAAYAEAWAAGRVVADDLDPAALFAAYGVGGQEVTR